MSTEPLTILVADDSRSFAAAGLRCDVSAPDPLPPLPAAVEVAAFRIAQEALRNVVRLAGARRATVTLPLASA